MNKKLAYLVAATVSAAALMAVTALPASAAAGDTTTTFSLTGGSLSVAVAASAALTNGVSGDGSVTGQLGTTTVTDDRGGVAAWNATGASTTFTSLTSSTTSTGVSYTGGAMTPTGTITIASGTATTLTTTPATVAAPTAVSGNNTAAWNPTLTVSLPASAITGAYTGTVTTSVS